MLVFPVTKAVRGAPGPRGPDGNQVTHLLFITTAGSSVFNLLLMFYPQCFGGWAKRIFMDVTTDHDNVCRMLCT